MLASYSSYSETVLFLSTVNGAYQLRIVTTETIFIG